jgi:catechol 2,3-dioxygenase-like lactoylglutathione lyase family enzyme
VTRVTGIGGIFLKARDPDALRGWYRDHLGVDVQSWGGATFRWHDPATPDPEGVTVWSVFPSTSGYFDPSTAPFMVNYRVANLPAALDALRAEGCTVDDRMEESEYGKFGWVMDPEGNRVELWEPPPGRFPGEATASPR